MQQILLEILALRQPILKKSKKLLPRINWRVSKTRL